MIINQSMVGMASSRSYAKVSYTSQSTSLKRKAAANETGKNSAAALTLSGRSKEISEKLRELKKEKKEDWDKSSKTEKAQNLPTARSEEDVKLQTLRKILEALGALKKGKCEELKLDTLSKDGKKEEVDGTVKGLQRAVGGAAWVRQTETESFMAESEYTSFSGAGLVKTADGREISFNVEFEMSRSYMEYNHFTSEEIVMMDPLVINMEANVASVSDQKFRFDLDADGEMDEISFLNKGSGFLALDKNEDGVINDGSELFGTKSGDGFKDLAEYDEDGNGWIDENDSIFHKLKIWTKDEDGKDRLIGLGKAGVGAIYLGNIATKHSLNQAADNHTNAAIQKTGIYLKESGEAGTIQHVDFTF